MIYSLHPSSRVILQENGLSIKSDDWKRANQDSEIKEYKDSAVSDKDFISQKHNIYIMKNTDNYEEYRKAFNRFCYFCHIVPRGVVLTKYELKKGRNNKNFMHVRYSYNTKRLEMPEDTMLYHISNVPGIKHLNPTFRGKPANGFMYEKPRVYFTVKKDMEKALADYDTDEQVYIYACKNRFKNIFVDPLLFGCMFGAIYIETDLPIEVDLISDGF